MNIFDYLEKEHSGLKQQLGKIHESDTAMERRMLYPILRAGLKHHASTVEAVFCQTMWDSGSKHLQEKTRNVEEKHDDIEHCLNMLDITDNKSGKWLMRFGQLRATVEQHINIVESEIFPEARKRLSPAHLATLPAIIDSLRQRQSLREAAYAA